MGPAFGRPTTSGADWTRSAPPNLDRKQTSHAEAGETIPVSLEVVEVWTSQ